MPSFHAVMFLMLVGYVGDGSHHFYSPKNEFLIVIYLVPFSAVATIWHAAVVCFHFVDAISFLFTVPIRLLSLPPHTYTNERRWAGRAHAFTHVCKTDSTLRDGAHIAYANSVNELWICDNILALLKICDDTNMLNSSVFRFYCARQQVSLSLSLSPFSIPFLSSRACERVYRTFMEYYVVYRGKMALQPRRSE